MDRVVIPVRLRVLVKPGENENVSSLATFVVGNEMIHRIMTFSHNIFSGRTPLLLRPGRPRADWLRATYKDGYHYLHQSQTVFDVSDRQLLLNIQEAAGNTMGPFLSHFSKDKSKKKLQLQNMWDSVPKASGLSR